MGLGTLSAWEHPIKTHVHTIRTHCTPFSHLCTPLRTCSAHESLSHAPKMAKMSVFSPFRPCSAHAHAPPVRIHPPGVCPTPTQVCKHAEHTPCRFIASFWLFLTHFRCSHLRHEAVTCVRIGSNYLLRLGAPHQNTTAHHTYTIHTFFRGITEG